MPQYTTLALGEEDPTTKPKSEEEVYTTLAVGEEDVTSDSIGEEDTYTTLALGEEDGGGTVSLDESSPFGAF
jgi:hypothetical protein